VEPQRDCRVIETRATRQWTGEDGIVRSQIRPGIDFTVEDSAESLAATRSISGDVPVPVLVDGRGVRSATRESRLFWASDEVSATISAMAILVGSPVSRMIASFFIRLVRPGFRLRIFSDEAAAVRWIKEGCP